LGIDDDIVNRLCNLILVDVARPQVLGESKATRNAATAQRELHRVLQEGQQRRRLLRRRSALGKGQ
jgi:hypothetical protein